MARGSAAADGVDVDEARWRVDAQLGQDRLLPAGDIGALLHAAGEPKAYLHRSGRTARAGASGAVVTVATPAQAQQLVGLHQRAGVEAKHTDARTVDGKMTAEALASAPAMVHRAPRNNSRDRGGQRDRGRSGGRPYARNGGRSGPSRGGDGRRQNRSSRSYR